MTLTLQPGFKLDHYELTSSLGPALGAQLWLAENRSGQKVVARVAEDPEVQIVFREQSDFFERMLREQPDQGLCRMHGCSPFGEIPYTIEEHVEGGRSLARVLQELAPLSPQQAAAFFTQAVRCVVHLHSAGAAHGAIRPENIVVLPDNTLRLAGLAWGRILTIMLRRGAIAATKEKPDLLAYFAPEQSEDPNGFAPAADIFALGVLLYEMTTGRLPEGGSKPTDVNSGAPDFADYIYQKCVERNPAQRFQEAGEILRRLRSSDTSPDFNPESTARDTLKDAASDESIAPQISGFAPPIMADIPAGEIEPPPPDFMDLPGLKAPAGKLKSERCAMSVHLVTARAFSHFLRETQPDDIGDLIRLDQYCTVAEDGGDVVPRRGMGNYPANQVSYQGAVRYCAWLSEELGVEFRLPSLAEWLAAAGAADGRAYAWGDEAPNAERACFQRRWCDTGFQSLAPVEAMGDGASPFGLAHLCGNVWEWTRDNAELYGGGDIPSDPDADAPPPNGTDSSTYKGLRDFSPADLKIVCGGSWFDSADDIKIARPRLIPGNYRRVTVGFRVAAAPEAAEKFGQATMELQAEKESAPPDPDPESTDPIG